MRILHTIVVDTLLGMYALPQIGMFLWKRRLPSKSKTYLRIEFTINITGCSQHVMHVRT